MVDFFATGSTLEVFADCFIELVFAKRCCASLLVLPPKTAAMMVEMMTNAWRKL